MAVADHCPNCDSELPHGAPRGLCPRCLLRQAFGSDAFGLAPGHTPAATLPQAPGPYGPGLLAFLAQTLGPLPHILLHDTEPATDPESVVQTGSREMPVPADPADRLQLLGEIARGGMGAVLRGRDGDISRDLAVKVLLDKHRDDPELIRRFIEEAQIAGQLQHPGIVPIYELGAFADRRPYFTMKLVKGRTLADLLDARPDPAADQPLLLGMFLQVCQAVAYAHARGVIHRDLKPSNVMVGSFGEVQVMDWGLAKVRPRAGDGEDAASAPFEDQETIIATARSGSDSDLSRAGSVMGTPAYMAPEQARGEIDNVDERADVFALGAILCEVITGRPAFTGRSSAEIQDKAAHGEVTDALARLDACGADAELLDLARACLAIEREDRPRDASGVASRLSAYLSGVQERLRAAELARAAESARAEEAQARAAVERSRRRRTAALAASLLAMMGLGIVTFSFIAQVRQARTTALERRLGRAATLLEQARDRPDDLLRWRAADAAVQQVEDDPAGIAAGVRDRFARLKAEATSGLHEAERDAALLQVLVEVRASLADAGPEATDAAYARAFREAGLDVDARSATEAARLLGHRPPPVAVELASYLDHWSGVRREAGRPPAAWRQPREIPPPFDGDDYRDRLRNLLAADDRRAVAAQLKALADEPRAAQLPAATAVLLGLALHGAGEIEAAVGLLRKAVTRHPDDVWVNFALAGSLERLTPSPREEALRYYSVARGLRPDTAHVLAHLLELMERREEAEAIFRDLVDRRPDNARHLACLGMCLKDEGRAGEASQVLDRAIAAARATLKLDPDRADVHYEIGRALVVQDKPADAEAEFRAALKLTPGRAIFHFGLGNALRDQGRPADAEAEFRTALKLDPDRADIHDNLGVLLMRQGKPADAEAEFRTALKVHPDFILAQINLGKALAAQARLAEAEAEYRTALKDIPDHADVHYNLGNALQAQGKPADAEAEYRTALKLDPKLLSAHSNLGAVLAAQDKPADAEAEYRAALKLDPDRADYHYNLGNTLRAQDKLQDAEVAYRGALRLKPDLAEAHCNLGLVLRKAGRYPEALEELRRGHEMGSRRPGWRYTSERWIRDTERMVALDARLPAVLKGDDRPADAAEALTLAQVCQVRKLHAGAARLYARAFQADPKLADDRRAQHPYNAACLAALAAAGQGKDDPPPDAAARARLRGQALAWLHGELAAWSRTLGDDKPASRIAALKMLTHWKTDPDLAGVRDEAALAQLPEGERQPWRALWADVETLLKKARGELP